MPTSDEELQAKVNSVAKLREKVARAEAQRLENERVVSNDIAMSGLEAEEARLQAQLAAADATKTITAVRSGAETPITSAKEQMKVALAQRDAAQGDPEAAAAVNPVSDTAVPVEQLTEPDTTTTKAGK